MYSKMEKKFSFPSIDHHICMRILNNESTTNGILLQKQATPDNGPTMFLAMTCDPVALCTSSIMK